MQPHSVLLDNEEINFLLSAIRYYDREKLIDSEMVTAVHNRLQAALKEDEPSGFLSRLLEQNRRPE